MESLKSTDYLLALALAYFVIKELISLIRIKIENKGESVVQTSAADETEILYRQNMMTQHRKMIEALTTCVGFSKSIHQKVDSIEKDVVIIKDRTKK